jgi:hypothetical protein
MGWAKPKSTVLRILGKMTLRVLTHAMYTKVYLGIHNYENL